MLRKVIALIFAALLSLGIVTGGVLVRESLSAGMWLGCAIVAVLIGAFLAGSVWQWADRDPAR